MRYKIIAVTITVLLMLGMFPHVYANTLEYTNEETNFQVSIEDDASLLSENEIDSLVGSMMPLTQYGNIAFKSILENDTSTQEFAREYYHNRFGKTNGSLLLIDMDQRMIYIFSDGENYQIITNKKADIITDNIYFYASEGNYYMCAQKAYQQMNALLEGNQIAEPMKYISNALISVVVAFLINFVVIFVRSRISSAKSEEIIKNCTIHFEIKNITGQKTGERRVYSPQSSGSSSGFSSGGHSSGGGFSSHSSGGGGGHRF